jgi:hypothetical protein
VAMNLNALRIVDEAELFSIFKHDAGHGQLP